VTDAAMIGTGEAHGALQLIEELAGLQQPAVIEVGTLRSDPKFPTHHTAWAPHGTWLKVDAYPGQDVDVVDDAHTLRSLRTQQPGPWDGIVNDYMPAVFDAYVACSVYEHLRRPWEAIKTAASVVRPGGLVYVQTHQTFPLHGYPSDYFRFSREALAGIMEDAGLTVLHTGYLYRCQIVPPPEVTRWNTAPDVEAWLNVEALARKPLED
jgi:SAM-dependent methyltransferase